MNNDSKKWCVYKHTCLINGKIYIGQTSSIKTRWKPFSYKNCTMFHEAIQKYGWENFSHEIIEDNLSLEEANEREEYWIKYYDTTNKEKGYNLKSGGMNNLHSLETKLKMSKTRKGVPKTEEHKKHISEGLKKYKRTEEHNLNNRLAQHGKKVECIETGNVYISLAEAQRQTGTNKTSIGRVCNGKQHTAGGYHWRFIDE